MIQVDIFSAISADGYLATLGGDSDWTDDDEVFEKTVREYGCIALGHSTFEQFKGEVYPLDSVQHLVLSSEDFDTTQYSSVHVVHSVREALDMAVKLGFQKLLVVGGGKTNESFMSECAVRGLLLDIHPLLLGTGLRLLGGRDHADELSLMRCEPGGRFVHVEYEFVKKETLE